MMTSFGAAAVPAASETIGSLEFEILDLDPDVAALMAEVDAILWAAPTPLVGRRRQQWPDPTARGPTDWTVLRFAGPPQRIPCEPVNAALRPENNP